MTSNLEVLERFQERVKEIVYAHFSEPTRQRLQILFGLFCLNQTSRQVPFNRLRNELSGCV